MSYRHILSIGVVLSLVSTVALAATQEQLNGAAQQSEQIQREQQILLEQQRQQELQNNRPGTVIEVPLPQRPEPKGGVCRDITQIDFTGGTQLSSDDQAALVEPYLNHCLGVAEIQSLLADVTALYIKRGYATARAYIPSQDMSQGHLQILIVEGRVQKLNLNDGENHSINLDTAFGDLEGGLLNLRDIEQGLDQANRLASNNATMDILPGDQPGESVIDIKNQPSHWWHLGFNGDNYGQPSTGRNEMGFTGSTDNLLGLNDFISISRHQTKPLQDNTHASASDSYMISIPYHYLTFTGGMSDSTYNSLLDAPSGLKLPTNGDSRNVFGTIDYVAYRDQASKVTLTTTVTVKDFHNYLAGQYLSVSSRRLTVWDTGGSVVSHFGGGVFNANLGVSRGLSLFGALYDAGDLPSDAPRAEYSRLNFGAGYTIPFDVAGRDFTYATQFTGQYGFNVLYGSEQMQIGGPFSVRGFFQTSLSNDRGYYDRNDLSTTYDLGPIYGDATLTAKPYAALDFGGVSGLTGTASGTLAGGAGGVVLGLGPAQFDVSLQHALAEPTDLKPEHWIAFGKLSINY